MHPQHFGCIWIGSRSVSRLHQKEKTTRLGGLSFVSIFIGAFARNAHSFSCTENLTCTFLLCRFYKVFFGFWQEPPWKDMSSKRWWHIHCMKEHTNIYGELLLLRSVDSIWLLGQDKTSNTTQQQESAIKRAEAFCELRKSLCSRRNKRPERIKTGKWQRLVQPAIF